MGIAIFVIGAIVAVCVIYAGIVAIAFHIINRNARTEAIGLAKMGVLAICVITPIGAEVLSQQQSSDGSTITEGNWQKRYCNDAGEEIFKTIENVRGLYFQPPTIVHGSYRFHENDGNHLSYLSRPDREYDFFEVRRNADELVERHEVTDGKIVSKRQDAPTARYAFTWAPITSQHEIRAGVHGQELEVFDRETGEILGRRTLFYFEPAHKPRPLGVAVPVCPQSNLPPELGYTDGQPRDSYKFISKILKPPAQKAGSEALKYDLFRGSGSRSRSCFGYIRIGPGITPKDLDFERIGHELTIKIHSTGDELTCSLPVNATATPDGYAPLKFADGHAIKSIEFNSRIKRAQPK